MKKQLSLLILAILAVCYSSNASVLPGDSDKKAIEYNYFPSRAHAFVFRNWTLVPVERLAEVLETSTYKVRRIARSMGLEARPKVDPIWLSSKGYITVLRRNWHLLPYEQLLVLLDLSEEELAWKLQEDDFLFVKLGSLKPHCEKLVYEKPDKSARQQSRAIKKTVQSFMKDRPEMSPRFDLFQDVRTDLEVEKSDELRMVFSYNAEYGDSLLDSEQSSYSDELLESLSRLGINSVWVHSVLRMLVPSDGTFPGDSQYEIRLANLNKLVQRASKYGIKVLLYVNEPRSMPDEWFNTPSRMGIAGVSEDGYRAICTSKQATLDWLSDSFCKVFTSVPELGGVFTITASENLTSCASHKHKDDCENCRERNYADIIADVNNAIAKGVKEGNPDAKVIVWDWGWNDMFAKDIINKLSKDCVLMSVSEWSIPVNRGGVNSHIGEYSISTPGPGPRASAHWDYAQQAGLKTVAKVMANTTWELGSVPTIPAVNLVAEHARNLADKHIDGVMMSWSLGGYPSVNLALFGMLLKNPDLTLHDFAVQFYGGASADNVEKAWALFSEGFAEFPYHMDVVYSSPHHMGPSNPFFLTPTGYTASMVGLPYDDLSSWVSVYPPDVFISQLEKIYEKFDEGVAELEKAAAQADETHKRQLEVDIVRAKAISAHYKSAANQVRFTDARNRKDFDTMKIAVESEKKITDEYMNYCLLDPTLGYESSNHYFFVPQDLVEKMINLEYLSSQLRGCPRTDVSAIN